MNGGWYWAGMGGRKKKKGATSTKEMAPIVSYKKGQALLIKR
jgi:hypothetical protein